MDRRKELKTQYKNTPPKRGVFIIRNLKNQKVLIVRALNVDGILNRHRIELKLGSHRNKELQNDYKKLGPQKFSFEVAELLKNQDDPDYNYQEDLQLLEEIWREKLGITADNGYN